ncbi:uncharacterized protein Z519_07749 [Cladophialophora bantiana CBS 173.52]|uniref:Uncharacterized protein n=1 Tax=Cladophialophora bantiana (strain ATCC 10958 / CBS 173.52 / CDC B-1940 / NIH 8579) TaxID=1442370 RepID=A0A0D2I4F8_CLAB1|nr:uncharacterized protein Z519_07749 [Cladophialophora bantiana CBS 173.52]KIW91779.1 hypothetical protein Z519_07749 [Cladophialophora bantiana CBS 173.52]
MTSGTSRKCQNPDPPISPDFVELTQKELKSEDQIQKVEQDEGKMQSAAVDAPLPSSGTPFFTGPSCQSLDHGQEAKRAIDTIRKFLDERESSGRTYLEIPLTYKAYNVLKEKYEEVFFATF